MLGLRNDRIGTVRTCEAIEFFADNIAIDGVLNEYT